MSRRTFALGVWLAGVGFMLPRSAIAQFEVPAQPAIGESYHVELMSGLWKPTFDVVASSSAPGIEGTGIDLETDLGIEKTRFREFRVLVRPGRKHKFRIQYLPARYKAETILGRELVFNGTRFEANLPVQSTFDWQMWRLGYQYDFVYRSRGFIGFIAEMRYTEVDMSLESPLALEQVHTRAPIPALGSIGRAYVTENTAITFEMTGFKIPGGLDEGRQVRHIDWDLYGTANFSHNFGFQIGYRSIDASYVIDNESGDLKLTGLYFAAVTRF